MKKLSDIAKQIIDNRLPGANEVIFNNSLNEFMTEIISYNDSEDLLKIIEYDRKYYHLPFDACKAIFNRLTDIGGKTPFVLRWYAFILRFYGDPGDYKKADNLEKEAEDY
jgi:hypothetical protein